VYSQHEALKLNDFEVYISMLKFLVGIGVFQRPYLYQKNGVLWGVISDIIGVYIVITCNANLVKAMQFMPKKLTTPD
jgi:amino acid permease